MDCQLDFMNDFDAMIVMLDKLSKRMLSGMAFRVSYSSIPLEAIHEQLVSLSRDERKEIYLFLAVYGTGLSTAGCLFVPNLYSPPIPASLFTLLMTIVANENVPVDLLAQTTSLMRSLMYSMLTNLPEVKPITALFQTAYLDKQYADK